MSKWMKLFLIVQERGSRLVQSEFLGSNAISETPWGKIALSFRSLQYPPMHHGETGKASRDI